MVKKYDYQIILGFTIFVLIFQSFSSIFVVEETVAYAKKLINPLENEQNNTQLKPHVVVAIIDSGINVYHEIFRRINNTQHPSTYIEGFPKDAEAVDVTFGDTYQNNYEQDKDMWEHQLQQRTLYWFPHTNIIGISFGNSTWYGKEESGYPIIDEVGHGTDTASVIATINPNATIVMVEVGANKLKDAFSWAINQSWIDIIDIEFGINYKPRVFFHVSQW